MLPQPVPSTQTPDRLAIKLNAERLIRVPIEQPTERWATPSSAAGLKEASPSRGPWLTFAYGASASPNRDDEVRTSRHFTVTLL
jgi:hypothetical protein